MLPPAFTGCGSENAPLTRWPGAVLDGSLTASAASPAVEVTLAVPWAMYSRATPGVNAPKLGTVPSVSDSVAGTVPPTVPVVLVEAYAAEPVLAL